MFETRIPEQKAKNILNLSEERLKNRVDVKEGVDRPVSIRGIEVELGWDNPESLVISHFWLDEKLRGYGIGHTILSEIIKQARFIDRINTIYTSIQRSDGKTKHVLEKRDLTKL